ncbi:MAG: CDP-diacylglycerol--glycerol-3-phosphate 3-phosphatidyltransferase [Pirellulales bacterium]|nr:CDP-diacylglycerol--glycerol-3-phosphate 3-phosphatidyltransferase [Pirellulales bacterium]
MNADGLRPENVRKAMYNLPNLLTALRLLISAILFCFILAGGFTTSLVLFIIAAGTDWLDGYYARKYHQVTTLGRILDPFADKVIICGTFILLAAVPEMIDAGLWGLQAWMVVIIVGRELLVTTLRSFIERQGGDFSAKMAGKLKMVLQCVAAAVCLFYLSYDAPNANAPDWCRWLMAVSVWGTMALTIYSGGVYVLAATRLLREE